MPERPSLDDPPPASLLRNHSEPCSLRLKYQIHISRPGRINPPQTVTLLRTTPACLAEAPIEDASTPMAVAIDGKTLRGSFDAFNDRKAAHVLSAFAADGQIILGHLAISQKSNEIPAAQEMIATLGLSGRLFTLDAMHCQKNFRDRPRHGQPSPGPVEGEPAQPA